MSNIFSLLKVNAINLFGINKLFRKNENKSLKILGIIGVCIAIVALVELLCYLYFNELANLYFSQGLPFTFISTVMGVGAMICFFFGVYSTSSVFFGAKDYELLASMPIKKGQIVFAKYIQIYLTNLIVCLLVSVFAISLTIVKMGFNWYDLAIPGLVMTLFLPLFPTAFSVLFGTIVTLISSLFRKKNLVNIIVYIILFVGVMAVFFVDDENMFSGINKLFFLSTFVEKGFVDWLNVLYFSLICLGMGLVVYVLTSIFYKKVNSALKSNHAKANYKVDSLKVNSQFKTYLKKEIKRLFSLPTYFLNTVLMSVFSVLMSVIILVLFVSLKNDLGVVDLSILDRFIPAVIAFFALSAPTTAASISLEGKSVWLIKSLPVNHKKLFTAKIFVNDMFVIPTTVLSVTMLLIAFGASLLTTIMTILIAIFSVAFASRFGLLLNLLFPKYTWENPNQPIKQSLCVFLTMMSAFIFAALCVFLAIVNDLSLESYIVFIIELALMVILTVITHILVYKKGEKLFFKKD